MLQKKNFTKVILFLLFSLFYRNAFAQQYSLVKDINTKPNVSALEEGTRSAKMGDFLYFTANDGVTGSELWRSDGTSDGTTLVKDIEVGASGSNIQSLTVLGNTLFFVATTIDSGAELWKTDGTADGTEMVIELGKAATDAGIFISPTAKNKNMVAYNGKIYFNTPQGVFESDGTEKGTVLFYNSGGINMQFEVFNGLLYLSDGFKLYKSDGSAPTILIQEGTNTYSIAGSSMQIKASSLGLMFNGKNTLWLTTGTVAETRKIYTATTTTPLFDLSRSTSVNNKFLYVYDDKDGSKKLGLQVWVTDGTTVGTKMLKLIGANLLNTNYGYFNTFNNVAYFRFTSGSPSNSELWKTDGLEANTIKLTTFNDTNSLSTETLVGEMLLDNSKVRFLGQYADGMYVCTTDGTVAGTVKDFKYSSFADAGLKSVLNLKAVGTDIIFGAGFDNTIGKELYRLGGGPLVMTITASIPKLKCNGDKNGTLEAVVTGTIEPIVYLWSSGQTTAKITDLGAGKYSVTATTQSGKILNASFTITEAAKFNTIVTSSSTPVGQKVGKASILVNGGLAPYTYIWNNTPPSTISTLKNVANGTYTVTVTDSNGCKLVKDVTVGILEIKFTVVKPIQCNGDKNGEVEVSVPEWTAGVNTFSWSDGTKAAKASNLGAGAYNLTITNATNSSVTATYTVSEPAKLSVKATITDEVNGNGKGKIELIVEGGTAPYAIKFPVGGGTDLKAGTYDVSITDANGCNLTQSFTVNNAAVGITQTAVVKCFGDKTAALNATTVGASTYLWNTGATTAAISNLGAGSYSATVTLTNGTVLTATKEVIQPAILATTIAATDATNSQKNGKAKANVTGGTSPYFYLWNSNPSQNTAEATGLAAGNYIVTVTDSNGCLNSANVTIKNIINTNDLASEIGLLLHPNPTASVLNVSIKNPISENYFYQVIDITGKVQLSGTWSSQNTNIFVDLLPSGTYMLSLKGEKKGVATASFSVIK